MALLEINNLEYSYGQVKAVKSISMHVNEGEIVTLIGSNGAGKTTLRTVSGLVSPQGVRGEILFDGQPIQKNPGYKIARLGLYQVLESRHVFPKLTIEENLATVRITSVTASRSKTASARSIVCSRAGGTQDLLRRQPVGRRAADAGNRPRAHQPAKAHDPR